MTLEELFSDFNQALEGAKLKGWGIDWDGNISLNMYIIDPTDGQRSQFIAYGNVETFEGAISNIQKDIATLSDRTIARKEKLDVELANIVTEAKNILTDEEFKTKFEAIVADVVVVEEPVPVEPEVKR